MADATITFRFVRARWAAQAFRQASIEVGRATRESIRSVGRTAETSYKRHAPTRTGLLRESIARVEIGRGSRTTIVVGADVRNPKTGYDYVPVTRFGHRVARIYPRIDRAPASVIETRRPRMMGGRGALRFVVGGEVVYRRSVRGYHPAVDWATLADPVIDAALSVQSRRIATRVERVIRG